MNIQNETKIVIGILLLSLSIAVSVSAIEPGEITKMTAVSSSPVGYIFVDEDNMILEISVIYKITVHGSPTYTYISKEDIEVTFNMSQPNKLNSSMVTAIKNRAMSKWG